MSKDKALYAGNDPEHEQKLTPEQAAELQLHGHPIADKDGETVTLPAKEILDNRDAEAQEKSQKDAEKEEKKTKKSKAKPKADDGETPLAGDGHAKEKKDRGPANAADEGVGYAPTGM